MAPQVVRIAIVFLVVICLFLGVRSQAVPKGFGEDGFHRIQAPQMIASRAMSHAGRKACAECHEDKFKVTPHVQKGVGCETCHGPALAHAQNFETIKPKVPSTRADCTRCHARLVGRPDWFPQIDPNQHNPGKRCMECHEIHPSE